MMLRAFAIFPLCRSSMEEPNFKAVRTRRLAGLACNPSSQGTVISFLFIYLVVLSTVPYAYFEPRQRKLPQFPLNRFKLWLDPLLSLRFVETHSEKRQFGGLVKSPKIRKCESGFNPNFTPKRSLYKHTKTL